MTRAAGERLIGELASGQFVSGESIAERLGITRAAVWKQVRVLRARGVPVDAVRGRGYRIHGGMPLLDRDRIFAGLHLPVRTRLQSLEVAWELDSTNTRLLQQAISGPAACVAEFQSAGRGRRGRAWYSPFGSTLCVSLAYPFQHTPAGFGGIGLVAGVAICDTLAGFGYPQVRLKWPNDLVVDGAKLGGLLVESRTEAGGSTRAVAGIGINWRLPAGADEMIDQRWVELASLPAALPPRDALIAGILNSLMAAFDEFTHKGFTPFRARWRDYDALAGLPVRVQLDHEIVEGTAAGIDDDGALRVATADGIRRFTAGEVSVRARGE